MKCALILLFTALIWGSFWKQEDEKSPPHIQHADRLTALFAQRLKEIGMPCSRSGGALMHDIGVIHLGASIEGWGTIEEVRNLLVIATEEMVRIGSADKEAAPYVRKGLLFSEKNISFSLLFGYKDILYSPPEFVCSGFSSSESVCTYHQPVGEIPNSLLLDESYQEAKAKVTEWDPKVIIKRMKERAEAQYEEALKIQEKHRSIIDK